MFRISCQPNYVLTDPLVRRIERWVR